MVTKLARPPTDLNSFLGRKWLESLVGQNNEFIGIAALPFILVAPNSDLTGSRYIAVNSSLTLVDGGAQQPITISLKLSNPNIFTAHQSVPEDPYASGWNGNSEVPTKNAVYDKIESIVSGSTATDDDIFRLLHLGY